jgi:hypothetical protein
MHVAELLVNGLGAYGLIGTVFAVAFVMMGIQRVDSVAEHAPLGFRLIVLPGVAALWPLMLVRWLRAVPRSTSR